MIDRKLIANRGTAGWRPIPSPETTLVARPYPRYGRANDRASGLGLCRPRRHHNFRSTIGTTVQSPRMSDILASRREALPPSDELEALESVERRVLWLATNIIHHANHVRPKDDDAEGRRPPGLVGLDGLDPDRALLPDLAAGGRPRLGQAARLAGPARDPVPARPARPNVPDRRCASSAACRRTRAARRTRTRSTSRPARSASAPSRRSSPRSPTATPRPTSATASRQRASSRSSATPSWTRATSGRRSSSRRRAGLGNVLWIVDLNRQSLDRVIPGIGDASSRSVFGSNRLARDRAEVRPAAAGGVRPAGRRAAAAAHRRDAQRGVPEPVRASEEVVTDGCSTARSRRDRAGAPRAAAGRRTGRRVPALHARISAATTSPTCSARSRRPAPRPTARRSSSPTRSRAGGCRSPASRSTTPRCCTGAQIDDLRDRARRSPPTTSGRASTRSRPRGSSATPRDAASSARPGGSASPDPGARLAVRPRPGAGLDPGGARARPARPLPDRRAWRADRDDLARRLGLDEPRRLDQQGRRLRPGRGALLRGPEATALLRWRVGAVRPAHRARHLGDEPVHARSASSA